MESSVIIPFPSEFVGIESSSTGEGGGKEEAVLYHGEMSCIGGEELLLLFLT